MLSLNMAPGGQVVILRPSHVIEGATSHCNCFLCLNISISESFIHCHGVPPNITSDKELLSQQMKFSNGHVQGI